MKLTRRRANLMLKYFIEKNAAFPDVWAVFEPNAFDGNDANFRGDAGTDETGRFIPTWSRGKDGTGVVDANKDYETKGPGDYYVIPRDRKRNSRRSLPPYPQQERFCSAPSQCRCGKGRRFSRRSRRRPAPRRDQSRFMSIGSASIA
jgi:hypothetical protein